MYVEMKDIKAVLFDMDGVIFDTERLAYQGWIESGRQLGFSVTDKQINQNRGCDIRSGRILFKGWFGEDFPFDEARQLRTDYMDRYITQHGTPVKPGVRELFDTLKKLGIKKALATSTQRETAKRYFKSAALPFDFDASVCGTEIKHSKPAPDVFLTAAQRLGEKPERCLVIEDSPNGVRSGIAAGCKVIMVPDMTAPDAEMKRLCFRILHDLNELNGILLHLHPPL